MIPNSTRFRARSGASFESSAPTTPAMLEAANSAKLQPGVLRVKSGDTMNAAAIPPIEACHP
ncbi:hypothetical protein, partial [Proteus mirabilis]|uniref:hypothetical protein n=1 Tax=Proteus mirabilis TaxID=584 RepID=UPI001954D149